jgi:hypothetical protein
MSAQCAVATAVRDVLRACRTFVFVCCVTVGCAVRGVLACAVLGDDADVVLCRVGLVASRVSARVCAWRDGGGERGTSRHVREVRVGPAKM